MQVRSVIIIPEPVLNAGWYDIAFKIENFIKCSKTEVLPNTSRLAESNYPCSKTVSDSKWISKGHRETKMANTADRQKDGLLKRCLVGYRAKAIKEKSSLYMRSEDGHHLNGRRHLGSTYISYMEICFFLNFPTGSWKNKQCKANGSGKT